MTDEKFVFIQDVKDKKITARSSHNRKTHAGKGGAVKFPSDYLSKKELKAMNSEVTTYRMNDPMLWREFKAMPDDIKVCYIKAIQQKYDAPVSAIAEMMGVHLSAVSKEMCRLKINTGKRGKRAWDKEGFLAWWKGAPTTVCSEDKKDPATLGPVEDVCGTAPTSEIETPPVKRTATPCSGGMTFEGDVDAALDTLRLILGGASVRLTVRWTTP